MQESKADPTTQEKEEKEFVYFNSKDWWSLDEIAEFLRVNRNRLKQLAPKYLVIHPSFESELDSKWRKELALLLQHEIEQSRHIPEDWKSTTELSEITKCPPEILLKIARITAEKLGPRESHIKSVAAGKGNPQNYYSPELYESIIEQLRLYPLAPKKGFLAINAVVTSFTALKTREAIPSIIKALKTQGAVKEKFFTSHATGLVTEYLPRGTIHKIREFINEHNTKSKLKKKHDR